MDFDPGRLPVSNKEVQSVESFVDEIDEFFLHGSKLTQLALLTGGFILDVDPITSACGQYHLKRDKAASTLPGI